FFDLTDRENHEFRVSSPSKIIHGTLDVDLETVFLLEKPCKICIPLPWISKDCGGMRFSTPAKCVDGSFSKSMYC
ncbi:hypothetical protein, partial [Vibrio parahaemolyticus]